MGVGRLVDELVQMKNPNKKMTKKLVGRWICFFEGWGDSKESSQNDE